MVLGRLCKLQRSVYLYLKTADLQNLQNYPHIGKQSTQFHMQYLDHISSYFEFRQQPGQLVKDCLMTPRLSTHFTSISLITKLEEIKEVSVLFILLRITNFSSGNHRSERPRRENGKHCKPSNTSRLKIVRQHLPSQFGGINVLASTAIK